MSYWYNKKKLLNANNHVIRDHLGPNSRFSSGRTKFRTFKIYTAGFDGRTRQ